MPFKITDIHHDSFIVKDLTTALAFYCNVLLLEIDDSRPTMSIQGVWLKIGEKRQIHLLEIDYPERQTTQPEHGGRDRHSAFLINNIETLKQTLDKQNIAYTASKSGRKALFTHDPDGNALEFIQSD
jgi:glyoxylase I family protein